MKQEQIAKLDALGVQLSPYSQDVTTELTWISEKAKAHYEPFMKNVTTFWPHIEHYAVRFDPTRKCAIFNFAIHEWDNVKQAMEKHGLVLMEMARFKKNPNSFDHRHVVADIHDGDRDVIINAVIADSMETAIKFRDYNFPKEQPEEIGKLLGFPVCCRDFYAEVIAKRDINDPIIQQAVLTDGAEIINNRYIKVRGSGYANSLLRYLRIRLVSHLPCSFQCNASILKGKLWYHLAKEMNPSMADTLLFMLEMPMKATVHRGAVIVKTPIFTLQAASIHTTEPYTVEFESINPQVYHPDKLVL